MQLTLNCILLRPGFQQYFFDILTKIWYNKWTIFRRKDGVSIEDAGISRRLSGNYLYALTSQLRSAFHRCSQTSWLLQAKRQCCHEATPRKRIRQYGRQQSSHVDRIGLAIARSIYERHQVISGYLMSIGVSEETALKDACRIEHVLSEETFHKIKEIFYQSRK